MRIRLANTIKEARKLLHAILKQGEAVTCPCCNQTAKIYPRKILGTMVMQLQQMMQDGPTLPRDLCYLSSGGVYAQLRWWGLATQDPDGLWICTTKGRQFLRDKIRVPEIAFVYNQQFLKFGGETVGVRDCLGKLFDYDETMLVKPVQEAFP